MVYALIIYLTVTAISNFDVPIITYLFLFIFLTP